MSGHGVEMLTSFRECVVFLEQAIKSCVSRDGNSRWTHRYEEITKRNGGSQPHPMILLGDYLEALSVSQQHLSDLHVIHVTGTKGKGSTCAFVESILRAHGYKTGLFTSPHLLSFTERFRIGGTPVSEDVFAAYLHRTVQLYEAAGLPQPPTFALLSLMCWYMFVSEKVDVAVIEVGIGGDFDFTNVVNLPAVCAFSSIGHDHMDLLGDTLQSIAFHKAGIMRPRIPAFSTEQLPEAMTALQHYADTLPTQLSVVRKLDIDTISTSMGQSFVLGLRGDFQLLNSALAVAVSREWLHQRGCTDSAWSPQITRALATCKWPGRAQLVKFPLQSTYFYIDGAHTEESVQVCKTWFLDAFRNQVSPVMPHNLVLLFACKRTKTFGTMLPQLLDIPFSHVMFPALLPKVPAEPSATSRDAALCQQDVFSVWQSLSRQMDIVQPLPQLPCVRDALAQIFSLASPTRETHVLVTGSLYLVSAVFETIGTIYSEPTEPLM